MQEAQVVLKKTAPDSEFSIKFLQGMVNAMGVSFFKYGRVSDALPHHVDALKSLEARIAKYKETGNTEWLIDAANFAMMEFMVPSHENAHYRATDSNESPGHVNAWTGKLTDKSNIEIASGE